MNILVIEDTSEKRGKLVNFLNKRLPHACIDEAESYNGGVNKVLTKQFDLILLDMSMPTFDCDSGQCSGRMRALAGRDVISKMKRRNKTYPVVVVTRFDVFGIREKMITLAELDNQLKVDFPQIYKGSVFFENSSNSWIHELESTLKTIGVLND